MIEIKVRIARHACYQGTAIAKIRNADIDYFSLQLASHDLFRGSLVRIKVNPNLACPAVFRCMPCATLFLAHDG